MNRPLQPTEIAAWKAKLARPVTPQTLVRFVEELRDIMGDHFVSQRNFPLGRESWIAAHFASQIGARQVQMGDRPDICITMLDGSRKYIEVTEALLDGRLRDKEYASDRQRSAEGIAQDNTLYIPTVAEACVSLHARAVSKAAKGYPSSWGLLIYFNAQLFGFPSIVREFERVLPSETEAAKDAFAEVWVAWGNRLYLVWEHGTRSSHPRFGINGIAS